jgi:hypothetical protein
MFDRAGLDADDVEAAISYATSLFERHDPANVLEFMPQSKQVNVP